MAASDLGVTYALVGDFQPHERDVINILTGHHPMRLVGHFDHPDIVFTGECCGTRVGQMMDANPDLFVVPSSIVEANSSWRRNYFDLLYQKALEHKRKPVYAALAGTILAVYAAKNEAQARDTYGTF